MKDGCEINKKENNKLDQISRLWTCNRDGKK